MPGGVEVEDVAHALHVEAASRDVGGDEDVDRAGLEPIELGDARRLVHVAVDLTGGKTVTLQALGELAHRGLAVAENDRGLDVVGLQQMAQRLALGAALHFDLVLGDVGVGRRRPGNLDVLGIGQELVGQLLDRRRHRRRKQQRLAVGRQLRTDRLDVGNEAHVEHAVGLVDDEEVAAGQHDLAALEQVHQPARRRDQHVDAFVQRLDLVAHLHAADQQRHLEIVVLAVFLEILGDLGGKLARRLEDQRARHQRAAAAVREDVDHRQHEAGGLAGAGLGDADDVLHHQHRRDRLRLDRGRGIVTGREDRLQQLVRQAEIGEFHRLGPVSGKMHERSSPTRLRDRAARVKDRAP